jgi:NADPH-dependent 7-cyano-7-deazaguanine reductase QueF
MIGVQPNYHPTALQTESEHRFDLPCMCPVSGNPQPGSVLIVRYVARDWFLEIETLGAYIESYIGGRVMGRDLIRDMEQTIQQIAIDCAASVEVQVVVVAELKIADDPAERTRVRDYTVRVRTP